MSDADEDKNQAAVNEAVEFAEEVEASGEIITGDKTLEATRAFLHQWVDTVTAAVSVPAFGRVTLVHKNGKQSTITSSELPFAIIKATSPPKAD